MPILKDLTGKTFGGLSVVSHAGRDKFLKQIWLCVCPCGKSIILPSREAENFKVCRCNREDPELCKQCGRSGVYFYPDRRSRFGHKPICIDCYNKRRNELPRRQSQLDRLRVKRAAAKQRFVDLAGGKCRRCGYCEFAAGLAFHHIDPANKVFAPTAVIIAEDFNQAFAELDKCILLCANCHFAYHAKLWTTRFIKDNEFGWTIDGRCS